MRYLIKFSKEDEIKFISHLDLMRTLQKIIRRAELPIEYSKGFNPHMAMSIAQPLSVGMSSEGEYVDIVLSEEMAEEEIKNKLNESGPDTIRFLDVKKVIQKTEKKVPQAMALIDAASYCIKIPSIDGETALKDMDSLMQEESWDTIKKSKRGEKEVDIKKLIHGIKYWNKDGYFVINAMIACGSREHLSPELVANYIKERCEGLDSDRFTYIQRTEMYADNTGTLVPLYKYI